MSWIPISKKAPPPNKVVVVKGEAERRAMYNKNTATFDDCDGYTMVFTVKEWKYE